MFASPHQEPVKYLKVTVIYPIIKQAKTLFLNKVRMTYKVFKKCHTMFQAGSLKRIQLFALFSPDQTRSSMFYSITVRIRCRIAVKKQPEVNQIFFGQPKEADTGEFLQYESNSENFAHS